MSIRKGIRSIRVQASTLGPLKQGHPWVFKDNLVKVEVGSFVSIRDERNREVAWGLGDRGSIVVRVLGRGPAPDRPLSRWLRERIAQADSARKGLLPEATDAYRVVSAAGDGLPGVVVDRYGPWAVLRLYSEGWVHHLEPLVEAVSALPWVRGVLRRYGVRRVDGRDGAEVLAGEAPPDAVVVLEAGMKLLVRPWVGQKTGAFLDQREHRLWVRRLGEGRSVANLFGYTGGFSVAAALGGATFVETVDLAPDAIEDAREIFRLNGIDPRGHAFTVADAFDWKPARSTNLLISDPPSLTRGARSDGAAKAAYRKLHRGLAAHIPLGGLLCTSSCTARLDLDAWKRAVSDGLAPSGDWSWHWCSTEPTDHPTALGHRDGHYLKFAILRRRSCLDGPSS